MNQYRVGVGILVLSAGTLLAVTLWKFFKGDNPDDEASQLCRLVSPRRSKDDDRRLQIKRRREYRPRNSKTEDLYHDNPNCKRQNTM